MTPLFFIRLSIAIFIIASSCASAEDDGGNISWTEQGGEKIVHVVFSGNEVVYFTQTRMTESGSYKTSDRREGVVSSEVMEAFISDLLALRILEWDQQYPAAQDSICTTEYWTLGLRLRQGTISSLGYCTEAPNFGEVISLFENLAAQVADK